MSGALRIEDFSHALPVLFIAIWACVVLLAASFGGKSGRLGPLAVFGLLVGLVICGWSWTMHEAPARDVFSGMLVTDRFAIALDAIFCVGGALAIMMSEGYLREHRFARGEFYALLLLAMTGMFLMAHAGDFVTMLIGIETMSLSVYALVASWVGKGKSAEAGLKYFIMGAVASAFFIYGVALIYGATGTTNLSAVGAKASDLTGSPLFLIGMFFVLGAMAFKVALVPFHMWTPDAYDGAPTPVTGFMAAAVKAAGFGALLRIALSAFGADSFTFGSTGWVNVFWTLSAITMTVGNVAALTQSNIKRMLAYSSVGHAGVLLMGVICAAMFEQEQGPLLYYLLTYGITTVGAFGVVAWIGSRESERLHLDDWAGLARRRPAMALTMTVFLLSLGGMPPTSGFFAKLYIFKSALGHDQLMSLVIVAVVNSMIAIYYYLRPVVAMYFREPAEGPEPRHTDSPSMTAALVIAAALVLLFGLFPDPVLALAGRALLAGG